MGNDFGWICMWTNAIPAEIHVHGNFIKKDTFDKDGSLEICVRY